MTDLTKGDKLLVIRKAIYCIEMGPKVCSEHNFFVV